MAAVFVVGCGIAMLWSAFRYMIVYRALADSIPPHLSARYAVPVYALSPSTPLPLQMEYLKSEWGGCVAFLCVSLCFFSLQQWGAACLLLVIVSAMVVSAIKSWKTYKANCDRMDAQDEEVS